MYRGRVESGAALTAPSFVQIAGHPLRWRLLRELARSDRRVRELVALAGQPQSLVSYHLGLLRASGLVTARRSSFDGRDTYYHLDLARSAESLAAAGAALHPGLRLDPAAPGTGTRGSRARRSVLFVCTGNSARSPMAAALARARSAGRVRAFSAGSHPRPVHPDAVRVMAERGIDLSGHRATHLSAFAAERFDCVITLCDRVREVCPKFPGHPGYLHWSIPDPAAPGGGDADTRPAFERLAADLETRVGFLLAAIGAPAQPPAQEA